MVTGNVQSDVLVRNPEKSGNRNIDVDEAPGRLVTGTWRCDHITPVLRPLHWLPVRQRIHFKIAICVFQALTGQAPAYLADDCQLMLDSDPCKLRSSDIRTCAPPPRMPNVYAIRWQKFFSCWFSHLEQSTIQGSETWVDTQKTWWVFGVT